MPRPSEDNEPENGATIPRASVPLLVSHAAVGGGAAVPVELPCGRRTSTTVSTAITAIPERITARYRRKTGVRVPVSPAAGRTAGVGVARASRSLASCSRVARSRAAYVASSRAVRSRASCSRSSRSRSSRSRSSRSRSSRSRAWPGSAVAAVSSPPVAWLNANALIDTIRLSSSCSRRTCSATVWRTMAFPIRCNRIRSSRAPSRSRTIGLSSALRTCAGISQKTLRPPPSGVRAPRSALPSTAAAGSNPLGAGWARVRWATRRSSRSGGPGVAAN